MKGYSSKIKLFKTRLTLFMWCRGILEPRNSGMFGRPYVFRCCRVFRYFTSSKVRNWSFENKMRVFPLICCLLLRSSTVFWIWNLTNLVQAERTVLHLWNYAYYAQFQGLLIHMDATAPRTRCVVFRCAPWIEWIF